MWSEHAVNTFWDPPFFSMHFAVCLGMGALVLRYAPGGDGVMNLMVATPVALVRILSWLPRGLIGSPTIW
jgi:hypothetical protein